MTHRRSVLLAPICLIAALLSGCVPVTEPLSDPEKAEPDKGLLGNWQDGDKRCTIDSPEVKGNPKSLMRQVADGKEDDDKNTFWFFTTKIGKQTYATIFLTSDKELSFADFRKEGAFETWNQAKDRRYFIFRYRLEGNNLTVDGGDKEAMRVLMKAEKIGEKDEFFKTPSGWLAKYLEKSGPETLFNGTNVQKWQREKK